MKTVLANGCFDILHVGHIRHLKEARQLGDRLVVALTEDEHVNKGEGRPINTWWHRAEMLRSLRYVDKVIPSKSCYEAIRTVKPDIFVKGVDYLDSPLLEKACIACAEVGAKLHITNSEKLSTTKLIERIAHDFGNS